MRSNFLKERNLGRAIKITDRGMVIVAWILVITLAVACMYSFIERKFTYPLKYDDTVIEFADRYNLDRALVFSVINVESRFDKKAVSSAGAVGLMQITPSTAEYIAKLLDVEEYELRDERTNVKFGCFYLSYLLKRFVAVDTAICAYNAGEGNVETWLKNKEYSKDGIILEKIPFKETQEYREKIRKNYKKYSQIYENILDKK